MGIDDITRYTAAELTLLAPDMLSIEVFSVADLSVEDRVARSGQAFDQHPDLRPLKVGPNDPPRIKVGDSMAAVLAAQQLPLDYWLMVRQSSPIYEGGELKLYPGRGRFLRLYTGEAGGICTRSGPRRSRRPSTARSTASSPYMVGKRLS